MCGLQNTFSVSIIFLQNRNKGFKSIFTVNGKQKAMILYKEVFEAKAAHLCGRSTLPATAVLQAAQASSKQEPYV
jgi:TorA maturation chaperone TorD